MTDIPYGFGRVELDRLDARLPLHARLRERLLQRIAAGEWTRDQPLPAESSLAAHYGVAVGTMRRVLGELADEGVVDRRHGKGTFVARADLSHSMVQYFELPPPAQARWQLLVRTKTRGPKTVRDALQLDSSDPVAHLRRVLPIGDTPRVVEDVWLPLPAFESIMSVDREELEGDLYTAYERYCGVVIATVQECMTVSFEAGSDAVLLRCAPDDPLIVIERTGCTYDRRPVEYARSRGQGSLFRHRTEYH